MDYIVVVQFDFQPDGTVLYLAHVFSSVKDSDGHFVFTLQVSVSAQSPSEALEKAEDVAWLLVA